MPPTIKNPDEQVQNQALDQDRLDFLDALVNQEKSNLFAGGALAPEGYDPDGLTGEKLDFLGALYDPNNPININNSRQIIFLIKQF